MNLILYLLNVSFQKEFKDKLQSSMFTYYSLWVLNKLSLITQIVLIIVTQAFLSILFVKKSLTSTPRGKQTKQLTDMGN